jgi:hypothetical protein
MKIYSFQKDTLGEKDSETGLYNLNKETTKGYDFDTQQLGLYVVPRKYEMRLDLISNELYGSPDFVEELMVINNIKNQFTIKEGDIINYINIENLNLIYSDWSDEEQSKENLKEVDNNKNTRKPIPPTSKPSGVSQIVEKDGIVKIINNFQR